MTMTNFAFLGFILEFKCLQKVTQKWFCVINFANLTNEWTIKVSRFSRSAKKKNLGVCVDCSRLEEISHRFSIEESFCVILEEDLCLYELQLFAQSHARALA